MAKLALSLTTKMLAVLAKKNTEIGLNYIDMPIKKKNSNAPQKPLFIKKNFFTTSSVITVLIYGIE